MRHCNKIHIFICFLFIIYIKSGRNGAIIVELKELFFLDAYGTFISPVYKSISPELHSLDASYSTRLLPSERVTVYSEPRTQSVVAAHYAHIQLKPRIYSSGFKAMQLERKNLVFRATILSLFPGFSSLDFSQLRKIVPALALYPVIIATNA